MSPLEIDALAGAALTPAIDRLRERITTYDITTFQSSFVRELIDIMTKARDALEAQDELLPALQVCCAALFEAGMQDEAAFVQGTAAIARATGGRS